MTKTAFCRVWVLVSFVLLVLVQWQLIHNITCDLATFLNFAAVVLSAVTRKSAISIMLVHQLDLNSVVIHSNIAVTARYCCSYRSQCGFHVEGDKECDNVFVSQPIVNLHRRQVYKLSGKFSKLFL